MAHRVITDAAGVAWDVWEVHPTLAERRDLKERRLATRPGNDRRRRVSSRPTITEGLRHGWLAFQSRVERRRRAPIPDDWESWTDDELLDVLKHAERTTAPRRLIE